MFWIFVIKYFYNRIIIVESSLLRSLQWTAGENKNIFLGESIAENPPIS